MPIARKITSRVREKSCVIIKMIENTVFHRPIHKRTTAENGVKLEVSKLRCIYRLCGAAYFQQVLQSSSRQIGTHTHKPSFRHAKHTHTRITPRLVTQVPYTRAHLLKSARTHTPKDSSDALENTHTFLQRIFDRDCTQFVGPERKHTIELLLPFMTLFGLNRYCILYIGVTPWKIRA